MAIEFQATSISGASAAAAGATAQSAIRDALVNHASGAWTLVEEFDSSGATIHWVVVKCSAALSGAGADFYVCIGRNASTGQLGIMLGEVYTAATHTLSTYAPYSGSFSNNQQILADFSFSPGTGGSVGTFALGTTMPTSTVNPLCPLNAAASTMRFIKIVDVDHAIIMVNGTPWYIGALTDLIVPVAGLVAAVPIGLADISSTNTINFGSLTRHPIAAADAPMQVAYSHMLVTFNDRKTYLQRNAYDLSVYGFGDRFQNGRVAASELAAVMYGSATGQSANNTSAKLGALRGKFKHLRVTTLPVAATVGDTIIVDGRKHIYIVDKGAGPTDGEILQGQNYNTIERYGFVADTGVVAP